MKLHDLHLSLTDAEALAAMLDANRRSGSAEAAPAEALAETLAHARRLPAHALASDRVAMGSTVTYLEEASGRSRTVTLAFPAEADLALGRVSVLSPIGRSLLGRKRGDIVDVALPGRRWVAIHIVGTKRASADLREAA